MEDYEDFFFQYCRSFLQHSSGEYATGLLFCQTNTQLIDKNVLFFLLLGGRRESNPQLSAPQADALTIELRPP